MSQQTQTGSDRKRGGPLFEIRVHHFRIELIQPNDTAKSSFEHKQHIVLLKFSNINQSINGINFMFQIHLSYLVRCLFRFGHSQISA